MSHANSSAQARLAHFKAPNPAAVAYYGSDSVRYALAQDCAGSIPKTSTAKSTKMCSTASPATGRTGLRRRRTRRPEAFANAQNPCRSSSSACRRDDSRSQRTPPAGPGTRRPSGRRRTGRIRRRQWQPTSIRTAPRSTAGLRRPAESWPGRRRLARCAPRTRPPGSGGNDPDHLLSRLGPARHGAGQGRRPDLPG